MSNLYLNPKLFDEDVLMHQKTAQKAAHLVHSADSQTSWIDNLINNIPQRDDNVKQEKGVDPPGVEPGKLGLSIQLSEPAGPTRGIIYKTITRMSKRNIC